MNTSCMTIDVAFHALHFGDVDDLARPVLHALCCTIRSTAEAICSRMARTGRSMPGHQHHRFQAGERVARACWRAASVSEPSWPVFMAWSMSSASPPRHSPTTIRSGRMRRQFTTRSRIVISPLPSMLAGARLQRDHVLLPQLQFGRVLDR